MQIHSNNPMNPSFEESPEVRFCQAIKEGDRDEVEKIWQKYQNNEEFANRILKFEEKPVSKNRRLVKESNHLTQPICRSILSAFDNGQLDAVQYLQEKKILPFSVFQQIYNEISKTISDRNSTIVKIIDFFYKNGVVGKKRIYEYALSLTSRELSASDLIKIITIVKELPENFQAAPRVMKVFIENMGLSKYSSEALFQTALFQHDDDSSLFFLKKLLENGDTLKANSYYQKVLDWKHVPLLIKLSNEPRFQEFLKDKKIDLKDFLLEIPRLEYCTEDDEPIITYLTEHYRHDQSTLNDFLQTSVKNENITRVKLLLENFNFDPVVLNDVFVNASIPLKSLLLKSNKIYKEKVEQAFIEASNRINNDFVVEILNNCEIDLKRILLEIPHLKYHIKSEESIISYLKGHYYQDQQALNDFLQTSVKNENITRVKLLLENFNFDPVVLNDVFVNASIPLKSLLLKSNKIYKEKVEQAFIEAASNRINNDFVVEILDNYELGTEIIRAGFDQGDSIIKSLLLTRKKVDAEKVHQAFLEFSKDEDLVREILENYVLDSEIITEGFYKGTFNTQSLLAEKNLLEAKEAGIIFVEICEKGFDSSAKSIISNHGSALAQEKIQEGFNKGVTTINILLIQKGLLNLDFLQAALKKATDKRIIEAINQYFIERR